MIECEKRDLLVAALSADFAESFYLLYVKFNTGSERILRTMSKFGAHQRQTYLRVCATQLSLERAETAIKNTERLIEESRKLLARPAYPFPSRAVIPSPGPYDIAVDYATPLVSGAGLNEAVEELRRAELEYGKAILALSNIWERLEVSLTDDLFREELTAKVTYDRAAARWRELQVRWFALQATAVSEEAAILSGPPPREWLN
jgi:hypothetical protein